jgi:enoyl-CoA hydratase
MEYKTLSISRAGHVVTCTLSNPPLNLMNATMVSELDAFTGEVEASGADRVLVVTGGADGIFITHYDVGELSTVSDQMTESTAAGSQELDEVAQIHRVLNRLEHMPVVPIAALNGTAMGGGCELSLACDLRVMADGPYAYGLPDTGVGIIPGAGGTQRFARMLGTARALDLILHGRVMTPAEALDLGLVQRVFPAAEFGVRVAEFAGELAQRAPVALAAAKKAIRLGSEVTLAEGIAIESRAFAETMSSEDAREAMRAYLKGESYEFKGR